MSETKKNNGAGCAGTTGGTAAIVPCSQRHTAAVRDICFRTGFAGKTLEGIVDNRRLFVDLDTCCFFNKELANLMVAESCGQTMGYIFIAPQSERLRMPRIKYFFSRTLREIPALAKFTKRDAVFYYRYIASALRGEFSFPTFYREFPSTLHINVAPEFQSRGTGTLLMQAAEKHLRSYGSAGVHFQTTSLNKKALRFYHARGYRQLYSRRTRFYEKWCRDNVRNIVMGKKFR